MHPGAMFPDIGHIQVILIQAGLPEGILEQGLQGPGGAGGNHHPVEPFFKGQFGDLLGRIGGA